MKYVRLSEERHRKLKVVALSVNQTMEELVARFIDTLPEVPTIDLSSVLSPERSPEYPPERPSREAPEDGKRLLTEERQRFKLRRQANPDKPRARDFKDFNAYVDRLHAEGTDVFEGSVVKKIDLLSAAEDVKKMCYVVSALCEDADVELVEMIKKWANGLE